MLLMNFSRFLNRIKMKYHFGYRLENGKKNWIHDLEEKLDILINKLLFKRKDINCLNSFKSSIKLLSLFLIISYLCVTILLL